MDPKEIQKRMQELQDSNEVKSTFSKLVSGKDNYETVIEKNKKKRKEIRCDNCRMVLEGHEKFCPECGNKQKKEDNQ